MSSSLLDLGFELFLKLPYLLFIEHTLAPFIPNGLLQLSDVAVPPQEGFLGVFKFPLFFPDELLQFSEFVLVDCAVSPLVFDLIPQEIELFLSGLNLLGCPLELLVLLVEFLQPSLQQSLQFPDGSLICQTFVPLALELITNGLDLTLQRSMPSLVLLNSPGLLRHQRL